MKFLSSNTEKAYVRTRLDEDVMKHLFSRFKKDVIKSFASIEKIFDDLNRVFENSNKRVIALKTYRRLKQVKFYREFHIF